MSDDHSVPTYSSLLVHPISILLWLVFCISAAFFEKTGLTLFFGFICSLAFCSYLWGRFALRRLEYSVDVPKSGIFPGQTVTLTRTFYNGKLLPLIWLELIEPCDPNGCAVPDEKFIIKSFRLVDGQKEDVYQCFYVFGILKWNQTLKFSDTWYAKHRGIHKINNVMLRSGDGFGLCAQNKRVSPEPAVQVVVYPRLTDVSVDKILIDMWDTVSAAYGYLEDITLTKSIRDYKPSDQARRINQRLLARGQGLKVNLYETVEPNSVLFILDSASFGKQDPDELEFALSVTASLIVGLSRRGIQVGLITPSSDYFEQTCVLPSCDETDLARMLERLAGAGQSDSVLNTEYYPDLERLGRTYYITYSFSSATSLHALAQFPEHKAQLLAVGTESSSIHGMEYRVRAIKEFWRHT